MPRMRGCQGVLPGLAVAEGSAVGVAKVLLPLISRARNPRAWAGVANNLPWSVGLGPASDERWHTFRVGLRPKILGAIRISRKQPRVGA